MTPTRKTPLRRKPKKKPQSKLAKAQARPRSKFWCKKADALWSLVIRAAGKCAMCGATKTLHAHHIIGRANKATRHMPSNGICLCPWCHLYNPKRSAHQCGLGFSEWLQANEPGKAATATVNLMMAVDPSKLDYHAAYDRLAKLLGEMESER
jgi:hypothetical protein